MANASLLEVTQKTFANFEQGGWPNCLIFSGEQQQAKEEFIFSLLLKEKYENLVLEEIEDIIASIKRLENPDLYYFPDNKIAIGDQKNPLPYTARHLLQRFIPYLAPANRNKYVIISNAARVNNEAESALLKTLEEPPLNTHFILIVNEKTSLKETIISRSIEVPYFSQPISTDEIQNEWELFWLNNGDLETDIFQKMQEKNWIKKISNFYDQLSFNFFDYEKFDLLLHNQIKSDFSKLKIDEQLQIVKLFLKPLQFAVRDKLVGGVVEAKAPFNIGFTNLDRILDISKLLADMNHRLEYRYFGTRPPHYQSLINWFLTRLFYFWN